MLNDYLVTIEMSKILNLSICSKNPEDLSSFWKKNPDFMLNIGSKFWRSRIFCSSLVRSSNSGMFSEKLEIMSFLLYPHNTSSDGSLEDTFMILRITVLKSRCFRNQNDLQFILVMSGSTYLYLFDLGWFKSITLVNQYSLSFLFLFP